MHGWTHVCHSQSSQVISLKLAAHPLTSAGIRTLSQMRRHIPTTLSAQTTSLRSSITIFGHRISRRLIISTDRRHGVLVWASRREMLARTNSTLDLLVSQLLLQTLLFCLSATVLRLSGLHCLPVSARSEDDILSN